MSSMKCHYCKESSDAFDITGQYQTKQKVFITYRLCKDCSKKFIGINTYSDKSARITFLNTVKANAKTMSES